MAARRRRRQNSVVFEIVLQDEGLDGLPDLEQNEEPVLVIAAIADVGDRPLAVDAVDESAAGANQREAGGEQCCRRRT